MAEQVPQKLSNPSSSPLLRPYLVLFQRFSQKVSSPPSPQQPFGGLCSIHSTCPHLALYSLSTKGCRIGRLRGGDSQLGSQPALCGQSSLLTIAEGSKLPLLFLLPLLLLPLLPLLFLPLPPGSLLLPFPHSLPCLHFWRQWPWHLSLAVIVSIWILLHEPSELITR